MATPDNRQPGQIPQSELLVTPEKRLAGKTAIVIGGNRDTGAGIVRAFGRQGATIASSFRDEKRRPQADVVQAYVEQNGGSVSFFRHDLSNSKGRQEFAADALGTLQGKVDVLVISTSGDSPELNQDLSSEMLGTVLPHMNDGGVVVRLQSVPGKYAPQIEGLDMMLDAYDNVASNKYQDLKALRARMPEMSERGIKFLEVTPPIIKEVDGDGNENLTTNIRLFNLLARRDNRRKGIENGLDAEQQHNEISDKLGLPRVMNTDQIGDKIVDLVLNPDTPSGHTEFFNGVRDVQTVLENWYKSAQVGVQTLERADILGMPVGVGRSIVSKEQVELPGQPPLLDEVVQDDEGNYVGKVTITPDHAVGHLNTENGLPLIFPGYKQIGAARECISQIENLLGNGAVSKLKAFEKATFERPVLADGTHSLSVFPQLIKRSETGATYNVEITNENGAVTTRIEGLEVSYAEDDNQGLSREFLIEAAAQTAGVSLVDGINADVMPLFRQVGPVEFEDVDVKAGAGLQYVAGGARTGSGIDGVVKVTTSHGDEVASIQGITAIVAPRKTAFRMIGYKPQV